jgi:hypothetical protein
MAFGGDGDEQAGRASGRRLQHNLDGHTDFLKTHLSDDAGGLFCNDGKAILRMSPDYAE